MKENEYQCARCGGIFESEEDWTEEKKWEEHDRNFPGESHETAERVCDDCYQQMVAIKPPPGMKDEQEIEDAMNEWCGGLGPKHYTKEEHAVLLELQDKIKKEYYHER